MTKKAMLDLYKEGIIPHIQIHDELDLSIETINKLNVWLKLWKMLLLWKSLTKLTMTQVKIGEV